MSNIIRTVMRWLLHGSTAAIESMPHEWYREIIVHEHERKRLENVVRSRWMTDKDLNRAKHLADLEAKVKRLQAEVTMQRAAAEYRNREAWATGLIVHCTGCDVGGPQDWSQLTEERVIAVEMVAKRLRTWWNNHEHRKQSTSGVAASG